MLKRELKITRKSLLIWVISTSLLFILIYLIYPTLLTDANKDMIDAMLKSMDPEILKMFNMDIISINTVFGWLKSEGYTLLILVYSIYSAILGSSIILKEESDKTIEYLISKPVTRNNILKNKIIAGLINIFIFIFSITLVNYFGLLFSNEIDFNLYLKLSILSILSSVVIYFLTIYISLFFNKTKKVNGLAIGLVFISYFLMLISNLGDKVHFIKYSSVFSLSDSRYLLENNQLQIMPFVISIILITLLSFLINKKYNEKELV